MISISPCVTATDAWLGLRPVANAFGAACGIMNSLGIGKFALAARRSITAYSRGDSSRLIGTAPLDFRAILSEKKYAPPFIAIAIINASVMPRSPPKAAPANNSSNVSAVSRNAVFKVFIFVRLAAEKPRPFAGPESPANPLDDRARALIQLCARLGFRRFTFKFHFVAFLVSFRVDLIARLDLAVEEFQRQRILNQQLDRALHRARAERRIVAFSEQQLFRFIRQGQRDLTFAQATQQVLHLQIDDVLDLIVAQWSEQDNV